MMTYGDTVSQPDLSLSDSTTAAFVWVLQTTVGRGFHTDDIHGFIVSSMDNLKIP